MNRSTAGFLTTLNSALASWGPLCGGLATDRYLNGIPEDSRFYKVENFSLLMAGWWNKHFKGEQKEKTVGKLNKLNEIAKELGCSLACLSLSWVIYNKDVSTAMTAASKLEQLEETLKAV